MSHWNADGFTIGRCLAIGLCVCAPVLSWAGPIEDATETGRLLAILLDAGRGTIAKNQDLINDASKGNKGYTSEVFERQVAEDFKRRTGIVLTHLEEADIPAMAKPLLSRLMEESKKMVGVC